MATPEHGFLSEENWEAFGLRLLVFTRYWARVHYGWIEGKTLPTGRTPEDLVIEVLLAYHEGRRTVTAGVAIYVQLKSSIKSVLWNLYRAHGSKRTVNLEPEDLALLVDESPTPRTRAQTEDFWKIFFETLMSEPAVARRPDLQALVLAFQNGAESIDDLVVATHLAEERISELKRQLRPIAEKAMAHLKKEGINRELQTPEGCPAAK